MVLRSIYEPNCVTVVEEKRPYCNICGGEIADDHCYVLDPDDEMEACVCGRCMEQEKDKILETADILAEKLLDWIGDHYDTTPARIEEETHSFFGKEDE